ncbi:protein suppressor of white apricot-like [Uranotaenia lowii]|uniref:protein suppressor of white apricot-like n=1 Tax=Uranotaenia lowii TaxID=190385 RepID=UPI00247A6F95|nr:protein suppressor of white apricot-like [Uranotaenia lowii]
MSSGSGEGSRLGHHHLQNNNGESGILRNKAHFHHHHHHRDGFGADNFADLLVFGYSCKVFRDDDKARFIDQGRHLIPWMGDNQLKIDRYDARGALHDLSQHEPPPGGYGNRIDCLPPAEQRAEQLCEEERYHSLYTNEVEEEIAQEEAAKRASAAGAEIAFNYDDPQGTGEDGTGSPTVGPKPPEAGEEDDSLDPPFVAPANFEIPHDLERPDTMKEHAIIEKTAKFIASQDSQMEILLKAKQAANPQFDFLNPGGHLYRYYRHVLMAVKTNQYPEEVPEEELNGLEAEPVESAVESIAEIPIPVPAIKYKPSVDCAYTQLISKITGAPIPSNPTSDSEGSKSPINPGILKFSNPESNQKHTENSVEKKTVPTGLAGLVQYNSDSDESGNEPEEVRKAEAAPKIERRKITFSGAVPPEIFQHVIEKTATYVVKNGYSFEEALRTKNDARFLFLRKDHEFYPYYAFRVRFLTDPYEEVRESPEKVTITREIENGTVVEMPSIGIKTVNIAPQPVPAPVPLIQATKPGGAVCFSIKNKDEGAKSISSSVVQELGGVDEEEANTGKKDDVATTDPDPVKEANRETVTEEEITQIEQFTIPTPVPPPAVLDNDSGKGLKIPLDEIKAQLPLDLIEPGGSKDQKRLEDRIKDKLATAARDKMAMIAKEKQLQLERKKKASMFLSLINKGEPAKTDDRESPTQQQSSSPELTEPSSSVAVAKNGVEKGENHQEEQRAPDHDEDEEDEDDDDDSSEMSVHSIPSHSPSPSLNQIDSSAEDDVVLVEEPVERPSRSRSRSLSRTESGSRKRKHKHKSKTSSSSSSKKSKKKKSKSASRSPSRSRSKAAKSKRKRTRSSRSRSKCSERSLSSKKKKKKSKKKDHKHRKSSRSSSSSRQQQEQRHHHHHHSYKSSHQSSSHGWEDEREDQVEPAVDYLSEERWKMLQYDL